MAGTSLDKPGHDSIGWFDRPESSPYISEFVNFRAGNLRGASRFDWRPRAAPQGQISGPERAGSPRQILAKLAVQGRSSMRFPIVGTGDFNGDGYADILWRDTSGNVAIWEMNGITVLNPNTAGVGNVSTTWSIVGTGDFNGDGYSDVLWHDTSGNVAVWFMNGTTVPNPNTAGVGNVTTSFHIAGSGDFNGDGKSDVLWRDTNGNVAVWFMNGTTVLNPNTAGVGNVPIIWTIQDALGR
jgi:hypothetical protein